MAYRTYLVTYKRTKFDITRDQKVMAESAEHARETLRDIEGKGVIIESAKMVAV